MYTAVSKKKNIIARIATKSSPCAFCGREVDDEAKYGKVYEIGDIHCHYFCALLSCCLIQKGQDNDGLFGFLYADILAEIARSKKHRCSFCGCDGANLGCTVSQCKKQFHLPCGRERHAVSMFFGNYKSYCAKHAPKQKISDTVMEKVKQRLSKKRLQNLTRVPNKTSNNNTCEDDVTELACVICYEAVEGCPSVDTFWPPCCGRDAWFHRSCLERMCLSAGVHYLKCPLCNDKDKFGEAVLQQGYYIPDRDAAWELEQNAFSEIYNTTYSCGMESCLCPNGRNHDAEAGPWDINLCVLCGSAGAHARCRAADEGEAKPYVCPTCTPSATSAPELIQALHELALQEQSAAQSERVVRPLMPSRMSLRRTKGRPSSSQSNNANNGKVEKEVSNTEQSRLELNLKTPKRCLPEPEAARENKLLSPMKQLGLYDRISNLDVDTLNADEVVEMIREKMKVPQPLAVKKKIVISILEDFMNTTYKDKLKMKEPLREWISPKKCVEIIQKEHKILEVEPKKEEKLTESIAVNSLEDSETKINESVLDTQKLKTIEIERDSSMEISKDNDAVNIDVVTREEPKTTSKSPLKITFLKLSPNNKDRCNKLNVDIDLESFKMQYLSETNHVNNRKRKLSDSDTKIDSQYQKEAKKRKRKEKKRKRESKEKRIKIELQINKQRRMIEAPKKDRSQMERSKLINKKNKDKIKIKLKLKKQIYKNGAVGKKDRMDESRTNDLKENLKIELEFNKDSSKDKEKSSKKSKKLKKYKFKKDKRKEDEHKSERKCEEKEEVLKESPKVLKQYQLNYFENKNKSPIVKPLNEVTLKRKYVRKEKGTDNFKQMSLDNFVISFL